MLQLVLFRYRDNCAAVERDFVKVLVSYKLERDGSFMKVFLVVFCILSSTLALAYAPVHSGYIKNVVEDDEGLKVILSSSAEKPQEIKTVYLENTQPEFVNHKQILLDAKLLKSKISISQDRINGAKIKVGE